MRIFDLLEARPIYDLLGHKGAVTAVQFSPKGDYIASGESENMVFVWKTNFDLTDKELALVAPSIEKQTNSGCSASTGSTTTKSVLKEQNQLPNKLISTLSLNGNKENSSSNQRINSSKVPMLFC